MIIELVGGPLCGEFVNVKYLDALVAQHDQDGNAVHYSRRDRPYTLSEKYGACYGQNGSRMYDYVRQPATIAREE